MKRCLPLNRCRWELNSLPCLHPPLSIGKPTLTDPHRVSPSLHRAGNRGIEYYPPLLPTLFPLQPPSSNTPTLSKPSQINPLPSPPSSHSLPILVFFPQPFLPQSSTPPRPPTIKFRNPEHNPDNHSLYKSSLYTIASLGHRRGRLTNVANTTECKKDNKLSLIPASLSCPCTYTYPTR